MNVRPLLQVACGVLANAHSEVLIAQRPPGKLAAGKWEFPGGKIEPGETPLQALRRELDEELGIAITQARPLLKFRYDYHDRSVVLDTWCVTAWQGALQSREGQDFAWRQPEALAAIDVLPTVTPILRALALPPQYVFTPPGASADFLLARIPALARGSLLRLRQPVLDDGTYAALAARLLPACRDAGLRLMLDRDPALVRQLGADGWHATSAALQQLVARPLPATVRIAASVHDAVQLRHAQRIDADCAVLGPVHATATHPDMAGIGWSAFKAIRGDAALSVYAIGGVRPDELEIARASGAQGMAGISAYWA